MLKKPKSFARIYMADAIPDEEREFVMKRGNRVNGADTLAKPMRDGNLVNLVVLYQERMQKGASKLYRAGITGTRRGCVFDEQLVQLALDGWAVSDIDFATIRKQQLAFNRKLSADPIGSLSDPVRRIDILTHEKMGVDFC